MITLELTEQQVQILRTALTQSRAEWCQKSTDALINQDMERFDVVSSIYARTVELDNLICNAK